MADPPPWATVAALAACEKEIVELHAFFVEWAAGRLPDAAFDAFLTRFSDDFEMVTPSGTPVGKVELGRMRLAKGSRPRWTIYIEEVKLRVVPSSGGNIVTGTYLELQHDATGVGPGSPARTNGRISTPLFELDATVRPNGVRWLRLAEVGLPVATMAAIDWEGKEMSQKALQRP